MRKKNNSLFVCARIEKSAARDHPLTLLGKPRYANPWSSGRISLTFPQTHDIFLYPLGGDANTQHYDAELEGTDDQLLLYGNDHCLRTDPFKFPGALSSDVKTVTVFIGNEYFHVRNNLDGEAKYEEYFCNNCLYGLNGQNDMNPDQYLYISINRVIQLMPSRNGYGVCAVKASWPCPCPGPPCP